MSIGLIILILIAVCIFIGMTYIKAPPDVAYIISGFRKESKVVIGKATIRIPFLERVDKIPLRLMQIDIKTQSAVPTVEFINIYIDGVANVKVATDEESLKIASQNFLNMSTGDISSLVQQVLEGNMREIVGQMKLTELVNQRDIFAKRVQENAKPDLEKMGLEIVNLNIQNFKDENNVINDLGIDNITKIQKDAQIAKANSERDVAVARAQADEEASKARVAADVKISEQQKELVIKRADFKKEEDTKKAEADAAYEIQKEEQKKTINEAQVLAEIAKREKEAELKEKEVTLKERELEALVKKEADAEKYKKEREAEAEKFIRQQEAEAKLYEMQKQADSIKLEAEAKKYAAELEAKAIKAKLEAEADGIKAKGLAEAESIEKKAEAMQKMGEASILEMYFKILPEVAKEVATPLGNVDNITMYGSENTTKLVEETTKNMTQILSAVKDGANFDLSEFINKLGDKITTKKENPKDAIESTIIEENCKNTEDKEETMDEDTLDEEYDNSTENEYEDASEINNNIGFDEKDLIDKIKEIKDRLKNDTKEEEE